MVIIRKIINNILNFIFPPQCYVCGKFLHGEDGLCFECLSKINFITKPRCYCCGRPFEFKLSTNRGNREQDLLCPKCLIKKHKFDRCISTVRYDDTSKQLILPLKHADKTQLAKFIGKIMFIAGREFLQKTDIIIPVPIHYTRLIKRKYNQAGLIANHISKLSGKPTLHRTLVRTIATKSQGHMNLKQRRANIAGAFTIHNKENITNKNILLIDDVYTTGSTVDECAKVLKKFGAKKVYVLTFAHT